MSVDARSRSSSRSDSCRLGVPGVDLIRLMDDCIGVGGPERILRPNLSTLGSSEDKARLRTEGRLWLGGRSELVEAEGEGVADAERCSASW
jgi:hypothetical protein